MALDFLPYRSDLVKLNSLKHYGIHTKLIYSMAKKRLYEILVMVMAAIIIVSYSAFVFYTTITVEGLLGNQKKYLPPKSFLYGIPVDSMTVIKAPVLPGQSLSDILTPHGIDGRTLELLIQRSAGTFDLRKIKAGNHYTLICEPGAAQKLCYLVYEHTPLTYVVFSLADTLNVTLGKKELTVVTDTLTGVIHSSLWNALAGSEQGAELALKMEEIFGWSVDFFGLQKGDSFKACYQKLMVENKVVGIERITSAWFNHYGKDIYAFWYEPDSSGKVADYFDDAGNSLRRAFLKAPLKFSRISSHFTGSRFHPVLKIYRAHHAVDYAAPKGTPVYAIGDGVVIAAGYSGGAGNLVKIRHNSVYTSQSCHFSKIAAGIKAGVRVKQGQIIGYVGSTGLSTGPHLDFRFYKNGAPVNPLKVESPPTNPVPDAYRAHFEKMAQSQKIVLNGIIIKETKHKTKPIIPFRNAFDVWPFNRMGS